MSQKRRILYALTHVDLGITQFSLSRLTRDMPASLCKHGSEVSIVAPKTKDLYLGKDPVARRLLELTVKVKKKRYGISVLETRDQNKVRVFLLECPLFEKDTMLADGKNASLKLAVYNAAVAAFAEAYPVSFDTLVLQGVQMGLVAAILKQNGKPSQTKIVALVENATDLGLIDLDVVDALKIEASDKLAHDGKCALLKSIYLNADLIVMPSQSAVEEARDPKHGPETGLESMARDIGKALCAIPMTVAHAIWDATHASDDRIAAYDADNIEVKMANRNALRRQLNLKTSEQPVFAVLPTLDQKGGIDLVADILDDLMERDISLIFAGKGDPQYIKAISEWVKEFPQNISLNAEPSVIDLKKILASSDVVLFPQEQRVAVDTLPLVALRYGCVPVIYADATSSFIQGTVFSRAPHHEDNAFVFKNYDERDFFEACMDAYETVTDYSEYHQTLAANAMVATMDLSEGAGLLLEMLENLS